jgi:hypothetical protein
MPTYIRTYQCNKTFFFVIDALAKKQLMYACGKYFQPNGLEEIRGNIYVCYQSAGLHA